jgi:hypothetical protein
MGDDKQEPSVTSFTVEHHALVMAWMARAAAERFGAAGEEAIRAGVRCYGIQRGQRMAATARAAGYPNDFVAFVLFGELDFSQTGNQNKIVKKTPHVEINVPVCGWATAWQQAGVMEYGKLYCLEIDTAVMNGFNPNFRFETDGALSNGAPHCRFIYYGGRLGPLDLLRLMLGKQRISKSALRPFEFHTTELWKALSQTLDERFPEAGQQVVREVKILFAEKYGAAAEAYLTSTASRNL